MNTPTTGISDASNEQLAVFAGVGTKTTPLGRIATPEETAKAVVFLAFEGTFITGTELLIDGRLRNLVMESY